MEQTYIDKITKKISQSKFFMVFATKNYLEALMNKDERIIAHIQIARKFKKPFLIIVDNRMKCSEIMQINIYFSRDNVIKKKMVDMGNHTDILHLAMELSDEIRKFDPETKEVRIATDDNII